MASSLDWAVTAAAFERHLLTSGKTQETARGYTWHSRVFWQWAIRREVDPLHATPEAVQTFLADQLATLAAMTAYNRLMAIRALFDYAIAEGSRSDNPTAGLRVKKPRRQPVQPFTLGEMQKLISTCRSIRDRAIILVLADTGIRIGELLRLKAQDIDWLNGTVRVYGKGQKERWVALSPEALEAVRMTLAGRKKGLIWLTNQGEPLRSTTCRRNLANIAAKAGVARTFPHRFRATFANFFLSNGGDLGALQSVLGHSDISTTNHYAGFSKAQRGLNQMRRLNMAGQLTGKTPS